MNITCILYKSDKKRFNHVYNNLVPKLDNINIVSAIDGKTDELEHNLGNIIIGEQFLQFARRGQIACLLSHIKVWKHMIQNNIKEQIILEDDANIPGNFLEQFNNIYSELPKDYDFLYLVVHPDCYKKNRNTDFKYIVDGYSTYGTVGYLITLQSAYELINLFKDRINTTVDDSISWWLTNCNKKYYCVKNNLVETSGNKYFHTYNNEELGSIIGETDLMKKKLSSSIK